MKNHYEITLMTHRETGLMVAVSNEGDIKGLMVPGRTEEEIDRKLPAAVKELLEARGKKVGTLKIERVEVGDFTARKYHASAELVAA